MTDTPFTIEDIRRRERASGGHFDNSQRYWGTRYSSTLFHADSGNETLFVTSEPRYRTGPRAYTVLTFIHATDRIATVGSMGEYETRQRAMTAARNAARER